MPPALRKQMAKVRADNTWFWKQSVRRGGLTESTPVRLRGNFGTDTDEAQERLQLALLAGGFTVINTGRSGQLTETLFETPARTWDLDAWNAWTDEMALLGAGVDFALFGGITEALVERDDVDARAEEKSENRADNTAIWRQLRAHGITTSTPIALDAHFWAVDEGGAQRLQDRLQTELGYVVTVDAPTKGWFRRSRPWSVTATRPATPTNEADVDAWTDLMIDIASATSTRFDGWGTWLPD